MASTRLTDGVPRRAPACAYDQLVLAVAGGELTVAPDEWLPLMVVATVADEWTLGLACQLSSRYPGYVAQMINPYVRFVGAGCPPSTQADPGRTPIICIGARWFGMRGEGVIVLDSLEAWAVLTDTAGPSPLPEPTIGALPAPAPPLYTCGPGLV